MNHQDHIKTAMLSEQFERIVSQIYSNILSDKVNDTAWRAQDTMDYAMTMAYMYTVNYDSVLQRHMIQRMKEHEVKQ